MSIYWAHVKISRSIPWFGCRYVSCNAFYFHKPLNLLNKGVIFPCIFFIENVLFIKIINIKNLSFSCIVKHLFWFSFYRVNSLH